MSINFPGSLDTLTNPAGTDTTDAVTGGLLHSVQHSTANDILEALEAKVGIDGSTVTTSLDYKVERKTDADDFLKLQNVVAALTVFMVEKLGYQPDTQEILDAYLKGRQ